MRRLFPVTEQTDRNDRNDDSGRNDGSHRNHGSGRNHGSDRANESDREWTLDELADAYAYPATLGTSHGAPHWLRANMVSTLDGAAQHDGRSQAISSAADMRVFGTLRALADVVVAGAETVRLEGYRPARARDAFAARRAAAGQAPAPAIAVVSASLNLDFSLPLFTSPLVPTLVLTGAAAPPPACAPPRRRARGCSWPGTGPPSIPRARSRPSPNGV